MKASEQAEAIKDRIAPMLAFLHRLKSLDFLPNDPQYVLVAALALGRAVVLGRWAAFQLRRRRSKRSDLTVDFSESRQTSDLMTQNRRKRRYGMETAPPDQHGRTGLKQVDSSRRSF
jgi:hypothetical protein